MRGFFVAFLCMFVPALALAVQEVATDTSASEIDIGLMFAGDHVYFFGTVPEDGVDVVVLLESTEDEPAVVNVKGQVGPVWMNTKQFSVSGLPLIYKIHATRPLNEIMDKALARELGLGYDVLKERMSIKPIRGEVEEGDKDLVFEGILKIRQDENLYNIDEKRVEVKKGRLFKHYFRFPSKAKEGKYVATSFIFKDGKLIGKGVDEIVIKKTGLEAMIATLAHSHPALYGVLAVFLAVCAGLFVGFIFKTRGGH